jgi:hypothetical protein
MKLTPLTAIAALLIIGAGGFMAGRISSSDSPNHETAGQNGPPGRSSRDGTSASRGDGSGPAATRSQRAERRQSSARTAAGSREERLERLESIVRGEDPLDRGRALLAYIDQLGSGDFEEAIAHFRSLGITESRMGEYSLLLAAWAKADPLNALEFATTQTGNRFATQTILSTWAASDPEGAIRWAQGKHEGDGANPYFAGIIRSLAESDPQRASDLLTSMPRSVERGEALDAMLPHLMRKGNDAARSWIDSLTDDALKNGAILRVADRLAAADPAGTAAWLLANPGEGTQRRMDDVYSVWAGQDQQAAMRSLASLPGGEERSNALRGVITSVASKDPQAAVTVMNRFQNDITDRVVQTFVWHSFGSDPSTAVNQIARITDERSRNEMYRRAVGRWIENDPSAATQWIRSNPLPDPALQEEFANRLSRQQ